MKQHIKYITNKHKNMTLLIGIILSLMITCTVYLLGGTYGVWANFMYISIALVASSNSLKKAIIHSAFSGLLIGPFMPLVTEGPIMQPTSSWIIRLIIYIGSAVLIHYYGDRITEEENLIQVKNRELLNAQESTLQALVNITETKDKDTKEHIDRIANHTRLLLTLLKESNVYNKELSMIDIDCVARASSLHDIGKVAISDTVLNKHGKLTSDEFEEMKLHTIRGAEALKTAKMNYPNNEFINSGYEITLHHHEWYDGTGYPGRLKGEMIPFTARVVSIVDVYDALRSKRPYKNSLSHDKAILIMKSEQRHFDPIMFDVFLKHSTKFQSQY